MSPGPVPFDPLIISQKLIELMLSLQPLIARHWGDRSVAELKPDGSWVTSVDRAVEAEIGKLFSTLLPEAYFLGEETHSKYLRAEEALLSHKLIVVVDPIDGTREYVEKRVDFGTLIGIYQNIDNLFTPLFGFAYRPMLSQPTSSGQRGMFLHTDLTGATQVLASIEASGSTLLTKTALSTYTESSSELIQVVKPSDIAVILPSSTKLMPSSASVVDLLCPILGLAHATINNSRFWDIAAPIAIASALKFPIWGLTDSLPIRGLALSDFIQDDCDQKWKLKAPIVIGSKW